MDYLAFQGATPFSMRVLRLLVAGGLPPLSHFGAAEVARSFAAADGWHVLDDGPTTIFGVPRHPGGPCQEILGYFGVLRRAVRR